MRFVLRRLRLGGIGECREPGGLSIMHSVNSRRSRASGLGLRTSRGLGLVPGMHDRGHVRGESGRRYLVAEAHVSWEAEGAAGFPSHLCPAAGAGSPGDIAGRSCGTERCTRLAFRPGSRRPGATGSGHLHTGGLSWRRCWSGRKNWSGCRRLGDCHGCSGAYSARGHGRPWRTRNHESAAPRSVPYAGACG